MGGVPEDLGIGGRGSRGQEAHPAPEGESADPSHDRDEQGAEDDLGPQDGPHRAEGPEERADEVRIHRRVEDEVAAQRRERHRRPPDPPADLDPARLVAGQGAGRLEEQIGHPEGQRHRSQDGKGPDRRGQRRGRGLGGSGHEDRPILDRPAARRPVSANDSRSPGQGAATIRSSKRRQHGRAGFGCRRGGAAAAGTPHPPAHRDRLALPVRGPRQVLLRQLDLGGLSPGLALDPGRSLPVDGVAPGGDRARRRGQHRRPDPDRPPPHHRHPHPRREPRGDGAPPPLLPREPAARGPRARRSRRRPLPRRGPQPDRDADAGVPRRPAGDGAPRRRPLVRAPPPSRPRRGGRGRPPRRTRPPSRPRSG